MVNQWVQPGFRRSSWNFGPRATQRLEKTSWQCDIAMEIKWSSQCLITINVKSSGNWPFSPILLIKPSEITEISISEQIYVPVNEATLKNLGHFGTGRSWFYFGLLWSKQFTVWPPGLCPPAPNFNRTPVDSEARGAHAGNGPSTASSPSMPGVKLRLCTPSISSIPTCLWFLKSFSK